MTPLAPAQNQQITSLTNNTNGVLLNAPMNAPPPPSFGDMGLNVQQQQTTLQTGTAQQPIQVIQNFWIISPEKCVVGGGHAGADNSVTPGSSPDKQMSPERLRQKQRQWVNNNTVPESEQLLTEVCYKLEGNSHVEGSTFPPEGHEQSESSSMFHTGEQTPSNRTKKSNNHGPGRGIGGNKIRDKRRREKTRHDNSYASPNPSRYGQPLKSPSNTTISADTYSTLKSRWPPLSSPAVSAKWARTPGDWGRSVYSMQQGDKGSMPTCSPIVKFEITPIVNLLSVVL